MSAEHSLDAFSQLGKVLFFNVENAISINAKRCWVVVPLAISFFAQMYYLTIDVRDVAGHVNSGNTLIAVGQNVDIFVVGGLVTALEVEIIHAVNVYFVNYERDTMQFVTGHIRSSFEKLAPKMQQQLIKLNKLMMWLFEVLTICFVVYLAFRSATMIETNGWTRLKICFVTLVFYVLGKSIQTVLYVLCVFIALSVSSLLRDIKLVQLCMSCTSSLTSSTIHLANTNAIIRDISRLNKYWKVMLFSVVACKIVILSVFLSSMLMSTMSRIIFVITSCSMIFLALACCFLILLPAVVHSKVKALHNSLLRLSVLQRRSARDAAKMNTSLKHFTVLRVFTLFDVAPATFDTFHEVISRLLDHFQTSCSVTVRCERGIALCAFDEAGAFSIILILLIACFSVNTTDVFVTLYVEICDIHDGH